MRIGCRIIVNNGTKATLGCFVSPPRDEDEGHWFTLSRHAAMLESHDDRPVLSAVTDFSQTISAKVRTDTDRALDTCVARVEQGRIGDDVWKIPWLDRPFAGVWNPNTVLERKNIAKTGDDEAKIASETIKVSHIGASRSESLHEKKVVFDGQFNSGGYRNGTKWLTMRGRRTFAGDSGGPVFAEDLTLIGFIMFGEAAGQSDETQVVLAYHVFEALGCNLVTGKLR